MEVLARLRWSSDASFGGYFNLTLKQMRLKSVLILLPFLPASVAAYGWVSEKHLHIAVMCVMLFLCGFSCMYVDPWLVNYGQSLLKNLCELDLSMLVRSLTS